MAGNSMPPSYNTATRQQAASANGPPYRGSISKSFQVTGILHIVAGGICIVLGIAAAVFKAHLSYLAFPIWGGLFIFVSTGIIGISYRCKPKSKCITVAYLVMTIISAAFSGIMFFMYSGLAARDTWSDHYYHYGCTPLQSEPCNGPTWTRVLMDALLAVVFILEMACGITAASVACFKVCKCCRFCCTSCTDTSGNSNVIYYAANGGAAPMVTVAANPSPYPLYLPAGASGSVAQPNVYLAASPQAQPIIQVQGQQVASSGKAPPQVPGTQQSGQVMMQVRAQGGMVQVPQQIQMIPAPGAGAAYPQVVMATQQQVPPPQTQPQQQPGPQTKSQEKELLESPEGLSTHGSDGAFGEVTSGPFSDQTALV